LQLRQALRIEKWEQQQAAHGDSLHCKGSQSRPTAARAISPRTIEQGISEHGVLLSIGASCKDTGKLFRRRQATAITQK
jgi:hypothetical protein